MVLSVFYDVGIQGAPRVQHTYWVTYFTSMARSIGGAFSQLTMIGVVAYGSTRVVEGTLSVGALAACTFLAGRSAQPMLRAFGLWTQFQGIVPIEGDWPFFELDSKGHGLGFFHTVSGTAVVNLHLSNHRRIVDQTMTGS